jgi:magnesium transporter
VTGGLGGTAAAADATPTTGTFVQRMPRRKRRRRSRPRDLAGAIAAAPEVSLLGQPAVLRLIGCDGAGTSETTVSTDAEIEAARRRWPVIWLDVEGVDDLATVRMVGDAFGIGPLALEDAVTPDERPKVEAFGQELLIAVRMPRMDGDTPVTEPLGIFLGERHVLTFHDRPANGHGPDHVLDSVRRRIRDGRTLLGRHGADHLCALLIDAVIDGFFPVLEQFGDRLEVLEDEAINRPDPALLARIHDVRHDLMTLRRALWPSRDVLHALGREATAFVGEEARVQFRDSYDHTMELLDIMESYREIGSDLRDIYLASLSNRMNDVMKLLTVIATVFMPLTFITGWFGMNFDTASPWNMPLLGFRFGALVAAGMMVASTVAMVYVFWRRGWLRPWR